MSKRFVLVCFLVVLGFVTGCEVKVTTAKLSDARMCLSVDPATKKPVELADVFRPDTPEITCSVKLSSAPETNITARWIYVQGEVKDLKDHLITEYSLVADGTRYLSFAMEKPDNGFPRGEYKVVLLMDGKEKLSVPFKVE